MLVKSQKQHKIEKFITILCTLSPPSKSSDSVCMMDTKHSCPQNMWIGIHGLVNNLSVFCKSLRNGSMKKIILGLGSILWCCSALPSFLYNDCGHKMGLRIMRPSVQFSTKIHGELLSAAPAHPAHTCCCAWLLAGLVWQTHRLAPSC